MKASFSLEMVAKYLLISIAIIVGIGIIYSLQQPNTIFEEIMDSEGYEETYICSEYGYQQDIKSQDLHKILSARYHKNCQLEENIVKPEMVVSKRMLKDIAIEEHITYPDSEEPKILFREECENIPGFEGIIVGSDEEVIFNRGDIINITEKGRSVIICGEET